MDHTALKLAGQARTHIALAVVASEITKERLQNMYWKVGRPLENYRQICSRSI